MRPEPGPEVLDEAGLRDDVEALAAEDPALAGVVERWGVPPLWSRPAGFASLALVVLEQSVSLASAQAVHRRLVERLGPLTAEALAAADPAEVRAAGASNAKARSLVGLGRAVQAGDLDLDGLAALPDDDVQRVLVAQPGLGPWTAQVYLLVCLRRRDVWPAGDRALQVALGRLDGRTLPTAQLRDRADGWQPRRSVAARLLWHDYLAGRPVPGSG